MASLVIEVLLYLLAAAAVGFMMAWLVSRARSRQRESQLASELLRVRRQNRSLSREVEHLRTPQDEDEKQPKKPYRRPRIHPVEDPIPTKDDPPTPLETGHPPKIPEGPPESPPNPSDRRRNRIAAVLNTPEFSYPVEMVVERAELAAQLRALGVRSTLDLLRKCGERQASESVASSTGIEVACLRRWLALADLLRVEHIRTREARLLAASGIDSSQALAADDARRVAARMAHASPDAPVPDVATVAGWIVNARALPQRIQD